MPLLPKQDVTTQAALHMFWTVLVHLRWAIDSLQILFIRLLTVERPSLLLPWAAAVTNLQRFPPFLSGATLPSLRRSSLTATEELNRQKGVYKFTFDVFPKPLKVPSAP